MAPTDTGDAAPGAADPAPPCRDGAADATPPRLDGDALRRFPAPSASPPGCACAQPACAGWESVGAPLGPPTLQHVGTLRDPADPEPTFAERRDGGHGYWSPQAPIAPGFFPYNRCEVWRCAACGRGFLQYTETGGYYVDHRIRQIDPALVCG